MSFIFSMEYSNQDNDLVIILEVDWFIPLTVLNRLARCCTYFWALSIDRLARYQQNRKNISAQIAPFLQKKLMKLPVQFTGRRTLIIPTIDLVSMPTLFGAFCFHPEIFTPGLTFAMRSIKLLMYTKMTYELSLCIGGYHLYTARYQDVVTSPFTKLAFKLSSRDHDEQYLPGLYLAQTTWATEWNPLVMNAQILPPGYLSMFFVRNPYCGPNVESHVSEVDTVFHHNISHLIVEFDTIEDQAVNWADYALMFDGDSVNFIWTRSLLGRDEQI